MLKKFRISFSEMVILQLFALDDGGGGVGGLGGGGGG
jgi:hypothetical protein